MKGVKNCHGRSWKLFFEGHGKSWNFMVRKEWKPGSKYRCYDAIADIVILQEFDLGFGQGLDDFAQVPRPSLLSICNDMPKLPLKFQPQK